MAVLMRVIPTPSMSLLRPALLSLLSLTPFGSAVLAEAPVADPVTVLPGESISEVEIRGLLAKLADMQAKQDSAERNALAEALKSLRAGTVGPTEAVNLYIASVRVVEFEKLGKKQADFDEWKKKNDDKLHEIPFGQSLMLQYGFLKLALESDTEDKRRAAGAKLVTMADDFMKALPRLGAYGKSISEDPFSHPVAKRFGLEKRKPEGWPSSPLKLAEVYAYVMKPVRQQSPKDLPALWESRIKQERALFGVREDLAKSAARKAATELFGKKIPKADAPKPDSGGEDVAVGKGDKFETTVLPKLQWEMGEDLYRSGLRRRGIDCMFTVISKNPDHPGRADWLKSLSDKAAGVAAESGVVIPSAAQAITPVGASSPTPAVTAPVLPAAPRGPAVPATGEDDPPLPSA